MGDTARPPDVDLRSWLAGLCLARLADCCMTPANAAKQALANADALCDLLSAPGHNARQGQGDADERVVDLDSL